MRASYPRFAHLPCRRSSGLGQNRPIRRGQSGENIGRPAWVRPAYPRLRAVIDRPKSAMSDWPSITCIWSRTRPARRSTRRARLPGAVRGHRADRAYLDAGPHHAARWRRCIAGHRGAIPGLVLFTLVDDELRDAAAGWLPRSAAALYPRARSGDRRAGGILRPEEPQPAGPPA